MLAVPLTVQTFSRHFQTFSLHFQTFSLHWKCRLSDFQSNTTIAFLDSMRKRCILKIKGLSNKTIVYKRSDCGFSYFRLLGLIIRNRGTGDSDSATFVCNVFECDTAADEVSSPL